MDNKFAIGIPTLNRWDLLQPALLFYFTDFPNTKIYIVDNGKQDINSKIKNANLTIFEPSNNLGVSASWNYLCDTIFEENDYAVILNDDIYLGRREHELDNLLTNHKKDFYTSTQDWCSFILPKSTYTKVGKFDIDFYPAYFEDNDYMYRMQLAGLKSIFKIPFLSPFLYKASMTLEKDPSIRNGYINNARLYEEKWGGRPNEEKFKTPYNK
jgi:GT2 family glycosyltransferase